MTTANDTTPVKATLANLRPQPPFEWPPLPPTDHAFTPRPIHDQRLISAFPRCAFPNCGGAQHEHEPIAPAFLAAVYGTDAAGRPTPFAAPEPEPEWVPTCGVHGGPMSREKGCLTCGCYESR